MTEPWRHATTYSANHGFAPSIRAEVMQSVITAISLSLFSEDGFQSQFKGLFYISAFHFLKKGR